MAETKPDKPGFFARLFGRPADEQPIPDSTVAPAADAQATPAPTPAPAPAELEKPAGLDLANAAADFAAAPAAPPPDEVAAEPLPEALAGADLQPIAADPAPQVSAPQVSAPQVPAPQVPPEADPVPAPATADAPQSWWQRLSLGMRRTSSSLSESVTGLFTKRKLDQATLDDLEDALVRADLGVATALRITEAVSAGRYDKEIAPEEVKAILAREVEKTLSAVALPLVIDRTRKPYVILMVGVNGAGKTTTIGKLSQKFRQQGLSVMLAAGDTFRAAAIEQLKVWGDRVGAPVIARPQGSDAAGLAFDALVAAKAAGSDVLIIDTAGRLQNKTGLMAELEKIVRVLKKGDPDMPHAILLVLDATVGQNALSQVELFQKAAGVTGLVMTKLDGTARGGILVALAARFGLPVHFIGVGEGVEDLEPFAARDFARAIAGLDNA
ncbi:signal recognition particle-docking protein FtsY [Microvirga antarctica]|uniref:signal recognition particle-docking protein FtsY n=1 Tax=Microvirga antarctica TaxID=2819233 RepID=UPI001B30D1E5|nr:signal recognition particle-docking protein FtsY [Microvirga antarctica]